MMEIRDYQPGDETQILQLFNVVFGKPLSLEYWKWRFLNNPENKIMIKLMWDKRELAGHYAVSPVHLKVEGQPILTALSMTTMTHPDYIGRGIFTDLAEALYQDEAKKNGLKAVFGFPNSNSHYGFIKNLRWKNLEQIPTLSIECSGIKNTTFDSVKTTIQFKQEHVLSQIKLSSSYPVQLSRSIAYLNWRYTHNPLNKYVVFESLNGSDCFYAVTKIFLSFTEKNKFEVDVLELNFPADYDLLLQLMNAIKNYYQSADLFKFNLWLPLNDKKHILLEKIGFVNTLPITYSGIRILDNRYEEIGNSANWHYSMGDSDIY